jgi:hypothetical protein
MEDSPNIIQQVDQERFADFRDTVMTVLSDKLRTSQAVQSTSSKVNSYKDMKDVFAKIKSS